MSAAFGLAVVVALDSSSFWSRGEFLPPVFAHKVRASAARSERIRTTDHLKRMGENVNWQKYDLLSLFDLQTLVATAQRLRQKGITIELRKDGVLIPVSKHSEDRV